MAGFTFRSQTFRQASALLAISALLSNILGLGRNLVFYRFVPLAQLDIYFASFRIADFLFNLIIFGAITSAIIPTLTDLLHQKKEKEAWETTNQLLSWVTLILLIIIVSLCFVMPMIVRVLVSGFEPARMQTTIELSRILLLQTILLSWSFIIGGLLNGYSRFSTYALAPLIYNISLILGGFLASRYGINAIIYSVIGGAALHFLIQYSEAYKCGYRFHFNFSLSRPLKHIATLSVPPSLSQGMSQVVLMTYTHLSSSLVKGSIAAFTGINNLQTTPTVVVANSLATAYFPTLSAQISKNESEQTNILLTKVIRCALFLLVPILVLSFLLRAQIVRLYLQRASWDVTIISIHAFVWFLVGIIPASLVIILARIFFAHKDTRTPMVINLASGALAILISTVGITYFHGDFSTLAISEALVSLFQCLLYFIILHRRGQVSVDTKSLTRSILIYLGGGLFMGLGIWATLQLVDLFYRYTLPLSTLRTSGLFIQAALASLVGVLIYFSYSTVSSKQELKWLSKKNGF